MGYVRNLSMTTGRNTSRNRRGFVMMTEDEPTRYPVDLEIISYAADGTTHQVERKVFDTRQEAEAEVKRHCQEVPI